MENMHRVNVKFCFLCSIQFLNSMTLYACIHSYGKCINYLADKDYWILTGVIIAFSI